MTGSMEASNARNLDAFIAENVHRSKAYLEKISKTFTGVASSHMVMKGKPEEVW